MIAVKIAILRKDAYLRYNGIRLNVFIRTTGHRINKIHRSPTVRPRLDDTLV